MSNRMSSETCAWQWHEGGLRTQWDGLRKDVDLWDATGDCMVFLYEKGVSRRPASIQISLSVIEEAECDGLLSLLTAPATSSGKAELYLGAPKHLNREDTFRWHLTTRNFFAWLISKPLAGEHLGLALSDLLERMNIYRTGDDTDNVTDLLDFAEDMGYTEMAHNSAYAVATLVFADHQELHDLWLDAFSHCVGMNDILSTTPDFKLLGNVNRALITKAALQMELDLEAKSAAIATMLEDDFKNHVGMTPSARQHLDAFRSFLSAYFVERFGYWPPRQDQFPKELYTTMAEEFESLYDLLADYDGSASTGARQSTTGGICVLQTMKSLHSRHGFGAFDAILPQLPNYDPSVAHRRQSNRSLRAFMSNRDSKAIALAKCTAAHVAATNSHDESVMQSSLVQAFLQFEADFVNPLESRVACDDARKIRWLLVYSMLQMLQSILRAPTAVTSRAEVSYPLCCNTTELPSWDRPEALPMPAPEALNVSVRSRHAHSPSLSIHPDGETDYNSYFAPHNTVTELASTTHPALRRLKPLRTMSLNLVRPARLSRVFSNSSTTSFVPVERRISEESGRASGEESPRSDVPSLEWSQNTSHSNSSREDLSRRPSVSSSIYSEPDTPAKFAEPEMPTKSPLRGDVLDKGLAHDDFICPGLTF